MDASTTPPDWRKQTPSHAQQTLPSRHVWIREPKPSFCADRPWKHTSFAPSCNRCLALPRLLCLVTGRRLLSETTHQSATSRRSYAASTPFRILLLGKETSVKFLSNVLYRPCFLQLIIHPPFGERISPQSFKSLLLFYEL